MISSQVFFDFYRNDLSAHFLQFQYFIPILLKKGLTMTQLKIMFYSLIFLSLNVFASESTKYKIEGMTCGGCVAAVEAQVCKLEGIESCKVKVGEVELSLKKNATLSIEKISEAVTKAGYTLKK